MCHQPKLGYNLLGNKYNNECNKLVKERKIRKNGFLVFISYSEKEEKMCFIFFN